MEFWDVVKAILALVLVVGLYFAFLNPIQEIAKSFQSIGKEEKVELTILKERCDEQIEEEGKASGCALEVASQSFKEDESSIIVESWIRKEIENTDSKDTLAAVLKFAQVFYAKSQDWNGALRTYLLLLQKLDTEEVRAARDGADLGVSVTGALKTYTEINFDLSAFMSGADDKSNAHLTDQLKEQKRKALQYSLREALYKYNMYNKDSKRVEDMPILGDCKKAIANTQLWDYSCNILSRETVSIGCYTAGSESIVQNVAAGQCTSCRQHPYFSQTQQKPEGQDSCSGYKNEDACEDDSCNVGDCKWVVGLTERCETVPGTSNYWDVTSSNYFEVS